jgi:hypothetical protein
MKERVNKPRAFLSYSSQDVPFIERIETDFRRCQIEPWRDRTDIRDGQPWLESIFEEGLPTCDVIIAYFTEHSLNSGMVAKEVDAAQLRQLKDNGISFLPYVSQSEIRGKLRLDIQTLQCRVWNVQNYHEILPSVISEIWRSYMERNTATAVLHEKNRRLELEIELNELKANSGGSGFTSQEQKEFRYIYGKLDELREISIRFYRDDGAGTVFGKLSFLKLLLSTIDSGNSIFEKSDFEREVLEELKNAYPDSGYLSLELRDDPSAELLMYGFLERKDVGDQFLSWLHHFTPRLYRFRFWLAVNDLSGETPLFDVAADTPE